MDRLMNIAPTPLAGVAIVSTQVRTDTRGTFARWFCDVELASLLRGRPIAQINHSTTHSRGTIRGLHFQYPPHAETKLVRCLRGRVFDVAVDLRAASPTIFAWHAEELSAGNGKMLVIPPGCAHGFQSLEPDCELLYLHTAPYAVDVEGGFAFDDPRLAITWPLAIGPTTVLSERDRHLPHIAADFEGLPA